MRSRLPLAALVPALLAVVAAVLLAACGAEPVPLHFAPPPTVPRPPPALPAPTPECTAGCLDRFFLLTDDDVVHVFDARAAQASSHADELSSFAAPAGTKAIATGGAGLLAMSSAGIDALDPASGAPLTHISDLTGVDMAVVGGKIAVAVDAHTVRFVDGSPDLHAETPIAQLFVYRGDVAYLTPSFEDTGEMHLLLDGADVDTMSGWGPNAPLGSDGREIVITFGSVDSALYLMDLVQVDPHANISDTIEITTIPSSWHLVDIAVAAR